MHDGPAARGTPAAPPGAAAAGPGALIATAGSGVELTVVVPTFEERDNIAPLVARLAAALDGIAWGVVFVDDDSPDGTAAAVRARARADAACASCNVSDGAASPVPVSRACCPPRHRTSP
jgi:hypothetical protein